MATNNLTVSFVHLRNGAKANRNLSRHHDNVFENSDNGLLEVRHRMASYPELAASLCL
jgi:hypothetical protein